MTGGRLGTVIVTGGAGAIGSRLVRRLLDAGAERLIVNDDFSSGHAWLLPRDPRLTVVAADVCELPALDLAVEAPLIFHLAAFFANQRSVERPLEDLHTNGRGTLTVLSWAADHGARRVVYASAGCSIAGHATAGPIGEDAPVSLHLDTPYQITKALGEFYCNYFDDRVSTVRCRFFNSYGPGEVPGRYRNVVPNWIWRALAGEPLVITGTGAETRDFVFVDDLVEGLLLAATTEAAGGGVFNLGTGVETGILTLAEAVIRACGSASRVDFAPRRPWDQSLRRCADISRARSVLGFAPKTTLEAGIARTVAWFVEHRERVETALHAAT